jgi:hypothetical protein
VVDRLEGWRLRLRESKACSQGERSIARRGEGLEDSFRWGRGRLRYDARFICLLSWRRRWGEGGPSMAGSM